MSENSRRDLSKQVHGYLAKALLKAVREKQIGPVALKQSAQEILERTEDLETVEQAKKVLSELARKYDFLAHAQLAHLQEMDQEKSQKALNKLQEKLAKL